MSLHPSSCRIFAPCDCSLSQDTFRPRKTARSTQRWSTTANQHAVLRFEYAKLENVPLVLERVHQAHVEHAFHFRVEDRKPIASFLLQLRRDVGQIHLVKVRGCFCWRSRLYSARHCYWTRTRRGRQGRRRRYECSAGGSCFGYLVNLIWSELNYNNQIKSVLAFGI